MSQTKTINRPIFFERNRVWRVYTGGRLFADFFGDEAADGFYPEEWVASDVHALNGADRDPSEGISRTRGDGILLTELFRTHRRELLGDRREWGVLVKLLDSAIRLPVQCHPDPAYSRRYLNSDHGKAESWVILETRENACIYFGFREQITKEEFAAAVAASEHDPDAMPALLNRIPVRRGDVFFIGSNMIHAIGAGCLLLETQEPTDFTVQPEHWCGDVRLTPEQMYLGLPADVALDCFNYDVWGDAAVALGRKTPHVLYDDGRVKDESLISFADTPCFAVRRLTLTDASTDRLDYPAVCVITEGEGSVYSPAGCEPVKKGDTFLLPDCLRGRVSLRGDGHMEVIVCIPPEETK